MFNFLNLSPEAFGVDINDLSLRLVKLQKNRRGFALKSYQESRIPEGVVVEGVIRDKERLARLIAESCVSVKGEKLGTRYAVVALPEEKSFSQIIQMPVMPPEDLEKAVPFEAENHIPLSISEVYLGFSVIGSHEGKGRGHLDVLVNVMPKVIVDSYVECIKLAGLIPCAMEFESQAMVRALVQQPPDPAPSALFIDFGQTRTSLAIFSGGSIRFTASIPVSSRQLTQAIADHLHISFAKAEDLKMVRGLITAKGDKGHDIASIISPILSDLADQVKKYLVFYQSHAVSGDLPEGGSVSRVVLCGGGSNLKEFPDFLSKKLKMKVEFGDPFVSIKNARHASIARQKSLAFVNAIGLAMRGAMETAYD